MGLLRLQAMLKQNRRRAIAIATAAITSSMALCVGGCGVKGPLQPPPKADPATTQSQPLPTNTNPSQLERRP